MPDWFNWCFNQRKSMKTLSPRMSQVELIQRRKEVRFRIWSSELSAIMSYHFSRLVPQIIVQADIPPYVNVFSTCTCQRHWLRSWHHLGTETLKLLAQRIGDYLVSLTILFDLFRWYWNTYIQAPQCKTNQNYIRPWTKKQSPQSINNPEPSNPLASLVT